MTKVVDVGQTYATQVGKAWSLGIGESASMKVGRSNNVEVGETMSTNVGKMKAISVGENFEIVAGEKFSISVGKSRIEIDKSGTIIIEAEQKVIVKGADAQFTIGPGPILYKPELVKGRTAPPPMDCLQKAAAAGSPFMSVR